YTFSYDHFLRKYRSGVGLMFLQDRAGSGALRTSSVGGLYSYVFSLSRSVAVRAGLRGSFASRNLDFYNFKFSDQIIRDDPFLTIESFDRTGKTYFDFGTGAILFTEHYWFGYALDHLNRPNKSFMGQDSRVPLKHSIQGGYRIVVKQSANGNVEQDVTIVSIYKGQQDWDQIDFGAYYQYNSLMAGMWYRGIPAIKSYKAGYPNNDAVIIMIGAQVRGFFHFGYSYDVTISKLGIGSKGAHEISMIYEFAQPDYKRNGKKQDFMVPCTKF
ncbi:MAG: PorP/SprF family type IX secretion system membrane protein, partial [Flavobacteriales bacterium]|nr:PorP/SprF family type IX secretion system membrane protein [Flavobacteriales bacterium]